MSDYAVNILDLHSIVRDGTVLQLLFGEALEREPIRMSRAMLDEVGVRAICEPDRFFALLALVRSVTGRIPRVYVQGPRGGWSRMSRKAVHNEIDHTVFLLTKGASDEGSDRDAS